MKGTSELTKLSAWSIAIESTSLGSYYPPAPELAERNSFSFGPYEWEAKAFHLVYLLREGLGLLLGLEQEKIKQRGFPFSYELVSL